MITSLASTTEVRCSQEVTVMSSGYFCLRRLTLSSTDIITVWDLVLLIMHLLTLPAVQLRLTIFETFRILRMSFSITWRSLMKLVTWWHVKPQDTMMWLRQEVLRRPVDLFLVMLIHWFKLRNMAVIDYWTSEIHGVSSSGMAHGLMELKNGLKKWLRHWNLTLTQMMEAFGWVLRTFSQSSFQWTFAWSNNGKRPEWKENSFGWLRSRTQLLKETILILIG